jgi:hypothetical protein
MIDHKSSLPVPIANISLSEPKILSAFEASLPGWLPHVTKDATGRMFYYAPNSESSL